MDQKSSQYRVGPQFASYTAAVLIRLLIVACGMLSHSSSMAVRSCWILAETGTHCCRCRSRISQRKLNCWHVWWVCRPWKNWDIFSFQEMCTDPCDMGSRYVMLKHELGSFMFLSIQITKDLNLLQARVYFSTYPPDCSGREARICILLVPLERKHSEVCRNVFFKCWRF